MNARLAAISLLCVLSLSAGMALGLGRSPVEIRPNTRVWIHGREFQAFPRPGGRIAFVCFTTGPNMRSDALGLRLALEDDLVREQGPVGRVRSGPGFWTREWPKVSLEMQTDRIIIDGEPVVDAWLLIIHRRRW